MFLIFKMSVKIFRNVRISIYLRVLLVIILGDDVIK